MSTLISLAMSHSLRVPVKPPPRLYVAMLKMSLLIRVVERLGCCTRRDSTPALSPSSADIREQSGYEPRRPVCVCVFGSVRSYGGMSLRPGVCVCVAVAAAACGGRGLRPVRAGCRVAMEQAFANTASTSQATKPKVFDP